MLKYLLFVIIILIFIIVFFYRNKKNKFHQLLLNLLSKGYLTDEDEESLNELAKSLGLTKATTDKIRINELNKVTQPIIDLICEVQLFSPDDERKLLTLAYNHRINATFEDPKFNIYRNYWSRNQYKKSTKDVSNYSNKVQNQLSEFSLPMNLDFIALDVETANEDYSSICQLGIVGFYNKNIAYTWVSLINPETNFSNTGIHGINQSDVYNSPKFNDLYLYVLSKLEGYIIIHHTSFDKSAIEQACKKNSLKIPNIRWVDSSRIARHTWENVRKNGFGLKELANIHNIQFKHHDALEDARVAGLITLKAIDESGISINDWAHKASDRIITNIQSNKPIGSKAKSILLSKSNLHEQEIDALTELEAWKIIYSINELTKNSKKKDEICFTGFSPSEKEELSIVATDHGLKTVSSITNNLKFLCTGPNAGPIKVKKAKLKRAIILNKDQFYNLLKTGDIPEVEGPWVV